MELEHHNDTPDVERQETEQSGAAEPVTFTTPFASEGLERLRDSHC